MALVTAPKPFTDPRMALIQSNALASWRRLGDVEIYLLGDEPGIDEAGARVGATVLKEVRKNSRRTPLVSSMMEAARAHSACSLFCLINADMIMMGDLLEAALAAQAARESFVLLGRRWDLRLVGPLNLDGDWEQQLRGRLRQEGSLHRPAGSDFFVFPRSCYMSIPDFAVGRAGWDNWMIFKARQSGWPVIDATASVTAIHQTHDYSHLPGGLPHYGLPETDENIRLAGGAHAIRYTIKDATHELAGGRLVRHRPSMDRLVRGLELLLRRLFAFLPPHLVEEVSRPRRWKRRLRRIFWRRPIETPAPGTRPDPTDD